MGAETYTADIVQVLLELERPDLLNPGAAGSLARAVHDRTSEQPGGLTQIELRRIILAAAERVPHPLTTASVNGGRLQITFTPRTGAGHITADPVEFVVRQLDDNFDRFAVQRSDNQFLLNRDGIWDDAYTVAAAHHRRDWSFDLPQAFALASAAAGAYQQELADALNDHHTRSDGANHAGLAAGRANAASRSAARFVLRTLPDIQLSPGADVERRTESASEVCCEDANVEDPDRPTSTTESPDAVADRQDGTRRAR